MQIPETLIIQKTEIHALRVCPCIACQAERQRIATTTPPGRISMTPLSAYHLGIIPRLSPNGSVAANLLQQQIRDCHFEQDD